MTRWFCLLLAVPCAAQTLINGARDFAELPSPPSSPPAGSIRIANVGNKLHCRDSAGGNCLPTSSGLTSNPGDAWFVPHGIPYYAGTLTATAGTLYLQAFQTQASMEFRAMAVQITSGAAPGTGACGCIYTRAANGELTRIAQTSGVVVSTARVTRFPWASGSAVASGKLTLPAGQNYFLGWGAEATPGIRSSAESIGAIVLNEFDGGSTFLTKQIANVTGAITGTGTGVTCPATIADASVTPVNRVIAMLSLAP